MVADKVFVVSANRFKGIRASLVWNEAEAEIVSQR